MAPKKKKKPAANPARGFATTSLPSKSKTVAEVNDLPLAEGSNSVGPSGQITASTSLVDKTGKPKDGVESVQGTKIEDMTPEQLEAHLENSELESVVDKYATRAVADARRQVARLQTERRQLRLQTQKLSTCNWLPEEAILDLFEMNTANESVDRPSASINTSSVDEEKLSVDLWTLERVLTSLDLPRVSEALAHVAKLSLMQQIIPIPDYLPGLPEALQWYASNVAADELLNYEQKPAIKSQQSGDSTPAGSISGVATATESRQSDPISAPDSEAEDEGKVSSSSSNSEEEDDDPTRLTEKYIRIQKQIWEARNQQLVDGSKTKTRGKRIDRLSEKLQHLRRDPLFDEHEAEEQWNLHMLELQAILQQQMRASANRRRKEKEEASPKPTDTKMEDNEPVNEGPLGDDEGGTFLGSIFGDSEDAISNTQNESTTEGSIKLLDFGKWSGLGPRKLLEEVCKGSGSNTRIQVRPLTHTSHSSRHRLDILWAIDTKLESHTVSALPSEVSVQIDPRAWHLEMKEVAAASLAQSEAYICTLALFLISTLSANDQKTTSRLPTVWRDLIKDLTEADLKLVSEEHKTTLRRLRAIIRETRDQIKQRQDFTAPSTSRNFEVRNEPGQLRRTRQPAGVKMSPEQVSTEWSARISRPSFQQMLQVRQDLPVHQYKDRILDCIAANPVSIICAETGAGKSSGIPVLLLEQEFSQARDCRVLVTQPRRISAVTLARRVSQELGEGRSDIGSTRSLVGYAIRLESKTSSATRITYATTGVLLRMLEESPDLDELDYLILDEVHERTMDLDLLFIALQKLQKRRDTLRIILMSATVDAQKFSSYFGGAPILDLPGRTFPVEVGFLEDAIEATNDFASLKDQSLVIQDDCQDFEDVESDDKGRPVLTNPEKYSSKTQRAIANMDEYRIDFNLIVKLAACIATSPRYVKYSSAILIFMPGLGEMRRLHNLLLSVKLFSRNWTIHLLHSTFSTEELERAFERPPPGHRKIVIATNIAETGITIPDVTAVIDTCKEKIMRFDERRQLSRLTEGFISRSSARQRRGRAARVQDGLCFHLVTKHRHDNMMLEQQVPEMLRLSLQDPMLRIKVWNLGSIEDTLSAAIDPPSRKNILRAIDKLKDAGALTKREALTPLGHQIARLPLEVSLAKLAIFGVIFNCLDPVLAVISLLTSKSPFLSSSASQADARHAFSRGNSDLLSSLNAYEGWKKAKAARAGQEFCRKNHLSDQAMGQVEEQKIQLLVYLVDAGVVTFDSEERVTLNRARTHHGAAATSYNIPPQYSHPISDRALNAIIAMALYPRILMREGKGWRNVYTNQMVSLTPRSVNLSSDSLKTSPRWLSFYEAMQNARSGKLNVFETSAIPESALPILLGSDAEFKFYAGVLILDSGKVKLSVRQWRELMAIKILRERVSAVLERCYRAPGKEIGAEDRKWLDAWLKIEAAQEA